LALSHRIWSRAGEIAITGISEIRQAERLCGAG